ncbi:hypothetical protein ACQ4M4_02260 [Leptolyngbya sp. AN02str]|uniref:hypothetical protein n=1 Tax=Leptolyngbya sp. AN02str TaxID=3423363 RepID=UPI003D318223
MGVAMTVIAMSTGFEQRQLMDKTLCRLLGRTGFLGLVFNGVEVLETYALHPKNHSIA